MKSVATCTLNGCTGASFNQPSACRAKHSTITATFTQAKLEWAKITSLSIFKRKVYTERRCRTCTNQKTNIYTSSYKHTRITKGEFVFVLTSELKRSWQMLQEITCFFLGGMETPNVWLITAFWTGSIWKTKSRGTHFRALVWTTVCLLSEFESFGWCKRVFLNLLCS